MITIIRIVLRIFGIHTHNWKEECESVTDFDEVKNNKFPMCNYNYKRTCDCGAEEKRTQRALI